MKKNTKYGKVREVTYSHGLATGLGPAVQYLKLNLADQSVGELEAWISNFGASNVWIFEGQLTLAECQGRITPAAAGGRIDGFVVTGSGNSRWSLTEDARMVTVFFEAMNGSGQTQGVGILVREYLAERE